jgi:protein-glutamine gamma-glutamyltransferase
MDRIVIMARRLRPPELRRVMTPKATAVERFFQFSLLGLVASGYFAVAGSGYLDTPTLILTGAGLLLRALLIAGLVRLEIPEGIDRVLAIAYVAFFGVDYAWLSRDFLTATVHLVFLLAVTKVLTAKTGRDYLYTAIIAFLELVAAAILSTEINFVLFLALYLLFAIAALSSGEIRRSLEKSQVMPGGSLSGFHPRLAVLSVLATLGILLMTGGLFFLLPRTAEAAFARLIPYHPYLLPGFSNQVTLGQIGEIKTTSRPVMHIAIFSRGPLPAIKWRGAALTEFDGKRWSNPDPQEERILVSNGHVHLQPAGEGRRLNYHVELSSADTNALFLAGTPVNLDLRQFVVMRNNTGSYHLLQVPAAGFSYDAYSVLEGPPEISPPSVPAPALSPEMRRKTLELPKLDPRIGELARTMAASAVTDLGRARAIERRLRHDYAYSLVLPSREVADPLADFLFVRRKGYCEHFASAMTVMLRTLGIPARLVTGFQSGVYNPFSDLWVVRASDAHSWVEAWLPEHGWTTFDPTPPDPNSSFSLVIKLELYLDAAQTFWQDWVVSYDLRQQGTLSYRMENAARSLGIRWFDSLTDVGTDWPSRVVSRLRQSGIRAAGLVLALALCLWWLRPRLLRIARVWKGVRRVRRGQASHGDATLLYERMLHVLKRRGYEKPSWFTPAEFAAALPSTALGAVVGEFTASYNQWRFGGRTDVSRRLSEILDELEHAGL